MRTYFHFKNLLASPLTKLDFGFVTNSVSRILTHHITSLHCTDSFFSFSNFTFMLSLTTSCLSMILLSRKLLFLQSQIGSFVRKKNSKAKGKGRKDCPSARLRNFQTNGNSISITYYILYVIPKKKPSKNLENSHKFLK